MSTPSTVATPAALIHDPLWSCPQPGMTSERAITQRGSSNSECLRGAGARRALLVSADGAPGERTPVGPISITPPSSGGVESVAAEVNGGGAILDVETAAAGAAADRLIASATRLGIAA